MKYQQKKSAVDLTELAIGIVVLGVCVAIGAVILTKIANTQITNAATYTVYNETVAPTTAGTGLSTQWVKSIDYVFNASNDIRLTTTNYTTSINSDNGVGSITNTTCLPATGINCVAGWKVTYTVYNTSDPRYDVPAAATTGLAEYGNWFKIIVIVGISAVILSLIFMAFGRGRGSSAVTY